MSASPSNAGLTVSTAEFNSVGKTVRRSPSIDVRDVSKTYPIPLAKLKQRFRLKSGEPVEALNNVSLDVQEGEVFGLIGRNGAGKTTLTKIIATLVQPTYGTVMVRGSDSVRNEEEVRATIGLAGAEERSFYWRLTVDQNLIFFSRLYGLNSAQTRQRIEELLELLELKDLRRRRFAELSTGNKQRMAVARALLNSPPVLLLDEPTRSLDPLAAARMRSLIGSLAHRDPPVTVLLTSHNLAEVEELCDRVAIINRGRIRAIDTPSKLRASHKSRERVRLLLRETSEKDISALLVGLVDDLDVSSDERCVVACFTREDGDDLFDRAVRRLSESAVVLEGCDTEHGTLLDALEQYEREDKTESEART